MKHQYFDNFFNKSIFNYCSSVCSTNLALAQDKPSLALQYQAIQKAYSDGFRQPGITNAQRTENLKKRDAALTAQTQPVDPPEETCVATTIIEASTTGSIESCGIEP